RPKQSRAAGCSHVPIPQRMTRTAPKSLRKRTTVDALPRERAQGLAFGLTIMAIARDDRPTPEKVMTPPPRLLRSGHEGGSTTAVRSVYAHDSGRESEGWVWKDDHIHQPVGLSRTRAAKSPARGHGPAGACHARTSH